jgi:phosphoribosylaminoimidazolecarboxamide formyltransferase/IMP cyclohydrolase
MLARIADQPVIEPGAVRLRRALLSVSDKRGIVDFARGLAEMDIELISTGGTAQELREAGLDVWEIKDFTGFPEIMDGRVKTLHPKLYAGLLAVRSNPEHLEQALEHGVEFVDLVCVNLYPFERTAAKRGVADEEVIENIDIGGPTMIRAAAKNHAFTAVVVRPESYDAVLDELQASGGKLSIDTRRALAGEAYALTARYDTAIARWFAEQVEDFPPLFLRAFEKVTDLRYGENPHQRAAFYTQIGERRHVLSMVSQLHGKELSFNNLLDLDAAKAALRDFEIPACVIVKHNNPCGVAVAADVGAAYAKAYACDPVSAFGGIIALNRRVDVPAAEALSGQFIEVLIAPGYDDDALAILTRKENVRIMEDNERRRPIGIQLNLRQLDGGMLVQDADVDVDERETMEVVTKVVPTDAQWEDLLFAWRVAKHVKSNAIVLARDLATVGVGAGQMSRVDSVRLAIEKAQSPVEGSVLASDAFFPFADGPEAAAAAGVTAIIQPGGSMRDDEVIEAADRAGLAMVFTRRRHFKH